MFVEHWSNSIEKNSVKTHKQIVKVESKNQWVVITVENETSNAVHFEYFANFSEAVSWRNFA